MLFSVFSCSLVRFEKWLCSGKFRKRWFALMHPFNNINHILDCSLGGKLLLCKNLMSLFFKLPGGTEVAFKMYWLHLNVVSLLLIRVNYRLHLSVSENWVLYVSMCYIEGLIWSNCTTFSIIFSVMLCCSLLPRARQRLGGRCPQQEARCAEGWHVGQKDFQQRSKKFCPL